FGQSDKPDAPYSMDYYLNFFPALMDSLNVQKADLVGISMGGGIALGTALRSPECVRRLVLADSYGLQTKAPMHLLSALLVKMRWLNRLTWNMYRGNRKLLRSSLKMLLHNDQRVTDQLVDLAVEETLRPDSAKAWNVFQESEVTWKGTRTSYMDRLSEIEKPVLLIHGRQDQAVPLDCSIQASRLIKGARLEILENCGHWPQRDQPEIFNRLTAEFLAG
ncbi:MAG: alpha/beta fold hydrolase, partial [Anaerolineaceae bacterium]